jgi:succinate dehydrogenase / fumarate reductase, membrane anchor subunit
VEPNTGRGYRLGDLTGPGGAALERVTAVALMPLTLWFVVSIIAHSGSDYTAFIAWLKIPLATCMMILLLIALFYAALGCRVIIEDYIHSAMKIPTLILMRLACFGLLVTGILQSCASGSVTDLSKRAKRRASSHSNGDDRYVHQPAPNRRAEVADHDRNRVPSHRCAESTPGRKPNSSGFAIPTAKPSA